VVLNSIELVNYFIVCSVANLPKVRVSTGMIDTEYLQQEFTGRSTAGGKILIHLDNIPSVGFQHTLPFIRVNINNKSTISTLFL
jgi:hypothetical protein